MKQKLTELRREIDSSTLVVRDSNTTLLIMDGTNRQNMSTAIEDLNNTINQVQLTDIYTRPTQQQLQTYSSQLHMEYFLGQTIF